MKISKSEHFKEEYCASVVRIGETFPIENKDRIVKTLINGVSIVIGKDSFKLGDVAVYVSNECTIHELFLHLNNMYADRELNIDTEKTGYFNNKGRVRCIKLGGVPSYGILLDAGSIAKFLNESIEDVKHFLENHVGEDFDEINDEKFCQVYVPKRNENINLSKSDKRQKKLEKFKMLIYDSFHFHYDTQSLEKNIRHINPDDLVDISVKLHGASGIFANILTNIPTNWFKRMWRKYITHKQEFDQKYNIVYSSRNTIKNEYINKKQNGGYYSYNLWAYWAKKLEKFIPKDFCIYGEIVGYTPNGEEIQNGYDYGCDDVSNEKSKLMIYRVTQNGKELEISDVIEFGYQLKKYLGDLIIEYPLLYHGTIASLYPELDVKDNWHKNVLEALKNEKKFLMEELEPMCNNKVPREGFILRKCNDVIPEAWKLKCNSFKFREAKLIDSGEVDIEMTEAYS